MRRQLMSRMPCDIQKIKREARESETPDADAWKHFEEPAPGHFWAYEDAIDEVRGRFLAQGRHPKVILKDKQRIKSLVYTFTKAD